MPSTRALAILAALAAGCSSGTIHEPDDPSSTAPRMGEIAVLVKVTGDPTVGPSIYNVLLNGIVWLGVRSNETITVPVLARTYDIELGPLSSLFGPLAWCSTLGATRQSVAVSVGGVQPATFSVDCPPLVGTGVLRVSVAASGAHIPADFQVVVTRLNGPSFALSEKVPANGFLESTVPAGVHRVTLMPGPNCTIPISAYVFFGPPTRAIHDGGTARVDLSVTCT